MLASSTKGAQIFQVAAALITIIGLLYYQLSITMLYIFLVGYFVYGCLGIVVTYHRYLTHKSYTARSWLVKTLSIVGCFGGTGSPIAWVAIHINHHLTSDKPTDPHSPLHKGIKIFSLAYENEVSSDTKWRMRDIVTDKFQQFLHRYYFGVVLTWSVLLLVIGGPWLMIFGHLAPAVATGLMSNIVNYVGHKPNWLGGYRSYNLSDQSTNNWLWAIPSWGETWHNNHHRFPKNFTTQQKWWELDISGQIIKLIRN